MCQLIVTTNFLSCQRKMFQVFNDLIDFPRNLPPFCRQFCFYRSVTFFHLTALALILCLEFVGDPDYRRKRWIKQFARSLIPSMFAYTWAYESTALIAAIIARPTSGLIKRDEQSASLTVSQSDGTNVIRERFAGNGFILASPHRIVLWMIKRLPSVPSSEAWT